MVIRRAALYLIPIVLVLGASLWSSRRLHDEAIATAERAFQMQQFLLASQAAERVGDLLADTRRRLEALRQVGAGDGWLDDAHLAHNGVYFIAHDADGRITGTSPSMPAAFREKVRGHAHSPPGGRWDAGRQHGPGAGAGCARCLLHGRKISMTHRLSGPGGPWVSALVDAEQLYDRLLRPLSRSHGAYAWVMRADRTILASPDIGTVGTRPFEALDHDGYEGLHTVLTQMVRGGEGTGRYQWGGVERLVAFTPVPLFSDISVAYSADGASVAAVTAQVQARHRAFVALAFLAASLGVVLVLWTSRRRLRELRRDHARVTSAETRYRTTVNVAAQALLEVDPDGRRIVAQNDSARALLGDVVGRPLDEIHGPHLGSEVDALIRAAEGQHPATRRLMVRGADGRSHPVEARGVCVRAEGQPDFLLWSLHDLTAIEQAHARMAQMEKLSTLGLLTASIGHEIKNPLAFVRANVEVLQQAGPLPPEEMAEITEELMIGINRMSDIVRAVGRAGRLETGRTPIDLRGPVRTAILLAGAHLRKHAVQLDTDLEAPLPVVGSHGEITQVVLNLVVNAVQACAGRGDGRVVVRGILSGDGAGVEVRDNGPGIGPDHAARLFQPFFSTKPEGEGTGLGLSISKQIAVAHRGDLRFEPGPDGAVFRLILPVADTLPAAGTPPDGELPVTPSPLAATG